MPTQPSRHLEVVPNPHADRDYEVHLECPEFTCLCPMTGQPDFATITVTYVPDEHIVELKSLKLYLWSFRDEGTFHEAVVNRILDDLVCAVHPRRMEVAGDFRPEPDGFAHACELVGFIAEVGDFCVGVAGYPEPHPETPDFETDVDHLAYKVSCGADFVVTQFFFGAEHYFRLRDALDRRGIDVPVIPGVMPVTNARQIQRMSELQGSQFPGDLAERLMAVEDDADAVRAIGVEVATKLCSELIEGGAP